VEQLIHAEREEHETYLTLRGRAGEERARVAIDSQTRPTREVLADLAQIAELPPSEEFGAFFQDANGDTRMLDGTRTLEENLFGAREAEITLVSELTGN
jgi:hypothetical protein